MRWRDLDKDDIQGLLDIPEAQAEVLFDLIQLCNKHGIDSGDLEEYLKDLQYLEDLSRDYEEYQRAIAYDKAEMEEGYPFPPYPTDDDQLG